MGDESMASGVSTGDTGGPPGAAAAGVGAEGIMKKLSNYWFIVGSIPLVMFLLVCLPTVFYVKSISEYKNAYYCRSKACDALASATKAAREAKPCDDYFSAVCKTAKEFDIEGVLKKEVAWFVKVTGAYGDEANPLSGFATAYSLCLKNPEIEFSLDAIKEVIGGIDLHDLTQAGRLATDAYKKICASALLYGIDCLFHLEWMRGAAKKAFSDEPKPVIGEPLPTPLKNADLSISAPDMGIMEPSHYIVTLGGNKYEDILDLVWKQLTAVDETLVGDDSDAPIRIKAIGKKMYELLEYSKDLDYTAVPRMTLDGELGAVAPEPGFTLTVTVSMSDTIKAIVPAVAQFKRFLLRSPNYVDLLARALNLCPEGTPPICYITPEELSTFVLLDTILRAGAFYLMPTGKLDPKVKKLWCSRYFDWFSPTTLAAVADKYLKLAYWPFGLKNPKDPKGQFPAFTLGMKYMSSLIDAFIHSYALSAASSEKSRAGLYTKMVQLDYMVFYPNSSTGVDDKLINEWNPGKVTDETPHATFLNNRKALMSLYWKNPDEDIKASHLLRHPLMFSDDVGSYDYGTNLMFVPFGMFRPSFYRDSSAYMGNYATFGYYGSMNIMKMIDNAGSYAKAGYNHPIMWPGTYAVGKMNSHYRCFNPTNANETDARLVAKGSNPISPGFRFFRRHALVRAHPRPEYRLDLDARADMEQIYLTAVMRTYCRYDKMKPSVNKMFQHNMYFQNAYCSDGGKLKMGADKMCYIWHSTRRNY
ncbi:uncharacterized protein [Dermacentor andersoni]|uniref:uncharacterized protein n=1 Tax=Dermacentor andersoni TaxID=34620 RepID=UPI0024176601|nr:uncharacterized protein LOC126520735 [Dermacentor andersoni]